MPRTLLNRHLAAPLLSALEALFFLGHRPSQDSCRPCLSSSIGQRASSNSKGGLRFWRTLAY